MKTTTADVLIILVLGAVVVLSLALTGCASQPAHTPNIQRIQILENLEVKAVDLNSKDPQICTMHVLAGTIVTTDEDGGFRYGTFEGQGPKALPKLQAGRDGKAREGQRERELAVPELLPRGTRTAGVDAANDRED